MMINNKIIFEEVEELKRVLSQGEVEIPSFWSCLWPGAALVAWNMLCAVISVNHNYVSDRDSFWIVVFSGIVSLMVLLGVASARSLFLSVPKSFRAQSHVYRYFSKKVSVYALAYIVGVLLIALYNRSYFASAFPFGFLLILMTIVMGIFMNLDFGRYQLSALTSVVNSFKDNESVK